MLELKSIKKDYPAGDTTVHALKGIDLQFRKSEFVSILGPSGCGKTTMLNIIGGLDRFTDGDLIINGKSTKDFKDRDWDAYRNHSIGFVFQSYNLIPHQTVLQNVEIALTLSGVSKAERRERAKKALEEVGLSSQLKKRPAEMSGGQMQRVAIARALVNNPDIILADEPTGALDTETSVQVMEILKEVSKNRLVIMVTHNPELAEKYSTRIIRMLDGEITGDTMPVTEKELEKEKKAEKEKAEKAGKEKKPSMSFATSFMLSLKNLFTKKGRTILTSFAGSIGIIGIALIFAVSRGMTAYIDAVQEDTLSSYPLTLEATHIDLGTMIESFMGTAESGEKHENDAVYQKTMMYDLINALNNLEATENDLKSFKTFIEERKNSDEKLKEALNGIQYTYNLNPLIYTKNVDGSIIKSDSTALVQELLSSYFSMDMSSAENMTNFSGGGTMMSMFTSSSSNGMTMWQEMLEGDDGQLVNDVVKKQYDVVYGSWPDEYNEVVLVLDENHELEDMTLYALGLKTEEEINEIMDAAVKGNEITAGQRSWSYEEICAREYRTILPADCYSYDEATGTYTDLRESDAGIKYLYDNGTTLKVSGIIRPNEDAVSTMITGAIGYTSALTEYIIENAKDSPAVTAQLEDPATDIFTGLPFHDEEGDLSDEYKEKEFRAYIESLDEKGRADAYVSIMSIPTEEQLSGAVSQAMSGMTREDMEQAMIQALSQQMGMGESEIQGYISAMSDEDMNAMFSEMMTEQVKVQFAAEVAQQLSAMSTAELAGALDMTMESYTTEQCVLYYTELLTFSDSTYDDNLIALGCVDIDSPATVNLFANSFENKDVLEEAIADYNEGVDDVSKISYTDYVGLMMSGITSVINAITYVLVSFVAISLIVSSIMIGVITLISVQERTKEIGILRAIGASKKEVSRMFNAETIIIGFTSGLIGVLITYVLCIPINIVIHALTNINNLNAYLPVSVAVALVIISVLLTLFSGIIPSKSAAKKDPVVALRTE